ncbi:MAG: hypothetical protein KIT46_02245 [Anaerolineales bacterium]|nr:hypothetical protein [Anaerolineales bacterium]MCW5854846.1 hypothetical protein [Anaerolineales bacterium]
MNKTVGAKEGLGAGVIGIGLMMLFLPGASQNIADLEFVGSEPFSILLGAVYVLGVIIILAGLGVIFGNFDSEE